MDSRFHIKGVAAVGATVLLFALPAIAGQITPSLQRKLQQMQSQDTIRVVVHLKAQVDWRLQPSKSQVERRVFLRRFSQEKQAPVLSFVRGLGESCRNIRPYWIFNGFAVTATKQAVLTIADQQAADFVTDIGPIQMSFPAGGGGGPVNQWNIIRVRAPEAWQAGYNGEGILVGEMDTGLEAVHPAFGGRWEGLPHGWYDAAIDPPEPNPLDLPGHGTHTMGILTAGGGIGVAPGATFMAVRIMEWNTLEIDDGHEGFEWVASLPVPNLPVVVNNSWGQPDGEYPPPPHANLDFWYDVLNWRALGIIPVFCIGNTGLWDLYPWDPGKFPTVIGVGATTIDNQKATFSLPGPSRDEPPYNDPQFWSRPDWSLTKPDLAAPGTRDGSAGIYSTLPNGGYGYMQGTSQAAPHVAGAIALMTQASRNQWHYDLNYYDLYDLLLQTANRVLPPSPQWPNNNFGWGLLDCYEAVNSVLNYHLKSSSPTATGPNNGDRVAYGGGKWHMVYETGGPLAKYVRYTVSTDAGATWSQEANGPTGERIGKIGEGGSPALSVESNGNAHTVWVDGPNLLYSKKLAASSTWTDPVVLYSLEGVQETPSLVVDLTTNTGHVAFVNASVFGRSVIYGWFDTQSPVLNTMTLDAGDVSHPSIGLGADGPHVAWRKKSSPKTKSAIYYACGFEGWIPVQLSGSGITCEHPDLVVSPYNQTVLVAWEQGEGAATDVWARRKLSGLGWQTLEQVCSTSEESRHPVIAANAYNNHFYADWADSTSDNDWEILANADYGTGWELGPYPNLSNTLMGSKNPQIGYLSSPMIEGTMVLAFGEGSSATPSLPTNAYKYVPVYEIRTVGAQFPLGGGGGQSSGRVNRPAYRTALLGCYPNPMVAEATLEYEIAKPTQASLKIFNVAGQVVKTLAEGSSEPGHYNVTWDGRDASGRKASSGIYFYRLEAGSYSKTNKLVMVR